MKEEDSHPLVKMTDIRAILTDVVGRANHSAERIGLTRHGKVVAYVVGVADVALLDWLDDRGSSHD